MRLHWKICPIVNQGFGPKAVNIFRILKLDDGLTDCWTAEVAFIVMRWIYTTRVAIYKARAKQGPIQKISGVEFDSMLK